ncbi:hypothetical protein PRNP1_015082 [Phytophthora ramorum]
MPTTFTGGRGVNNADLDVPKRLSFVSGASQPKDVEEGGYAGVKTPEHVPIGSLPTGGEGGAIREGGMPVLTSKENLEEKKEAANFKEYIASFWDLLTTRAVYQVIAYNFFSHIFADIAYTGSSPVQRFMLVAMAAKQPLETNLLVQVCPQGASGDLFRLASSKSNMDTP